MKHTPGPWEVCIGEVDGGLFEIYQDEINTICRGDDEMIDWKANARLIAASPEMASVLHECFDYLQTLEENSTRINLKMAICDVLQKAGAWEK